MFRKYKAKSHFTLLLFLDLLSHFSDIQLEVKTQNISNNK